jgi:hypothetical protein
MGTRLFGQIKEPALDLRAGIFLLSDEKYAQSTGAAVAGNVASGGGTGRTLHPDNMAAGPASYGLTDTMGRMHGDAQFAGSSSVPAHVEMMGFLGAGNNPMVGMTVSVAVAVEESLK